MDFFGKIRDNNKVIAGIVRWQKTVWFPIAYAALAVLACTFGMYAYVPVFYIYAVTAVFTVFFNDDIKVLLVPLLLTYFAIGGDQNITLHTAGNDIEALFEPAGLAQIIVGGVIIILALAYRLVRDGVIKTAFTRRGIFTFGLLALAVSFLLNGVFSPTWEPLDLAYGLFEAVGILLVYFIVLALSDRTKELIPYACKLCLICGLMIGCEVITLALKLQVADKFIIWDGDGHFVDLNRECILLGWGVGHLIAAMLATMIPAAMYVAHSLKHGTWAILAAVFFYALIMLLRARTSMLMGAVIFIACAVVCCVHGPNRKKNLIMILSLVGVIAIGFIAVFAVYGWENVPVVLRMIKEFLRFDEKDSGRFVRWEDGVQDFLKAPVFGAGFVDGGVPPEVQQGNVFANMYHNIGVEIIGSLGVVGVIAVLWHLKNLAEVTARRFRVERLLLMAVPLTVILTSLLDNFFFYFNIQMFYGLFLALAEVQLEETRKAALARVGPIAAGRKPRIAFTFVEAGKGHVMPELAVCEAFEKKYGDRAEVVRSRFYTETDDKNMRRFEDGFIRTVELQSRSSLYGKASMVASAIVGDALAQKFVMSMRYPDSKADRPAVKHLRDLNADLIFTTHWATAIYANRLKGARPFVVLFCPDAYANGMFNVDVNDFLIATPEGLDKVRQSRMYAGGNASLVPYPIRNEAFALRGRRAELRRELGIAPDAFTVVLADGGYGMAQLVATVRELAQSREKMTLIAVCGTNEKGCAQLRELQTSPSVDLRVFGFTEDMLKFVAAADLFVGKSGANSMAEPTFFGVPIIITKCITPIESGIKKYYVKKVGNARYIPDPVKAAEAVRRYAAHPEELRPLADRSAGLYANYGAEAIADLLYARLCHL